MRPQRVDRRPPIADAYLGSSRQSAEPANDLTNARDEREIANLGGAGRSFAVARQQRAMVRHCNDRPF